MTVMGYRIPKGITLVLAPYALHLSKANYIHPAKFWPERWLTDPSPKDDIFDPGMSPVLLLLRLLRLDLSGSVTVA